jgi:hypothetical protein
MPTKKPTSEVFTPQLSQRLADFKLDLGPGTTTSRKSGASARKPVEFRQHPNWMPHSRAGGLSRATWEMLRAAIRRR